jgi:hypothetical protein
MTLTASIIVAIIAGATPAVVIARALNKRSNSFRLVLSNPAKALNL